MDYSTGGGVEASRDFWWGLGDVGDVGDVGGLERFRVGVGTQSVFEFYLNRPRVGGPTGNGEYFSLLTAPCVLLFPVSFCERNS